MDTHQPKPDFQSFTQAMQPRVDAFLKQTWDAMQAARKGHWIEDTEEHVLRAGDEFKRLALQQLLQEQINSNEKSFSPSRHTKTNEQGNA